MHHPAIFQILTILKIYLLIRSYIPINTHEEDGFVIVEKK